MTISPGRLGRRFTRATTLVTAALATVAGVFTGAGPALAVNADHGAAVVSASPAAFTPPVMDGAIKSIVQIGNKMVAVGTFTRVRQSPNGPDIVRNRMFAFDATTGVIDAGFNPNLGGAANSIDTDGTYLYVGGSFGSVGGNTAIRRLVKLTATGAVVAGMPVPNGGVNEVVVRGNRLFVGGSFTSLGTTARSRFAVIDSTTGAALGANLPLAGTYNGGGTNILRMDVSGDGSKVVIVGNFASVGGQPRDQIAVINAAANGSTSVSAWNTDRYGHTFNNCAAVFNTFMRDVDIAPDGSYFVVTTTGAFAGGYPANTLCDTAARWSFGPEAAGQQPAWATYTGGDTTYGVAVTGAAVYVGGHMRWEDNPFQGDQAGPGAAPREGIAALDPVNGMPLRWNPGRSRGVGAEALYATPAGLWVGSDTTTFAGQARYRLAFLPLAGGYTLASHTEPTLPNDIFVAQRSGGAGALTRVNAAGAALPSDDAGPGWSADAGLVSGGNTADWGSGVAFDSTVPTTTPSGVFATERWGNQSWDLPIPNGQTVAVRLYFANQYGGTSQPGQRVFDVAIEGTTVLPSFDIIVAAGADHRGTMRQFTVTSDGTIDIDLSAIVENPLINAIEIVDPNAAPDGPGALLRVGVDGNGAPTGTSAAANTAIDWSQLRGAMLVGGTLYYGQTDGNFYARTFNPATAAVGAPRTINLFDDPDTGERIPFAIAGLSGMVYDPATHRIYYTVAGNASLFYRYFTLDSEKVGAVTFMANSAGVDFSQTAGLTLASGRLIYGSTADGALRTVAFAGGQVTGTPTVVSADGSWRYREMFVNPTSAPPPNQTPTAAFTVTCTARVCSFDGSGSSDPDGTVTGYTWTFGDAGNGTGVSPSHTYAGDGTYTVTLTVTDNAGASASTSQQVRVTTPPNQPPTAAFTPTCSGLTCSVNASASSDPDGTITGYAWSFGDAATGTGQTASHTYPASGSYTITLTVTDNGGATASTSRQVSVTEPVSSIAFRASASATGNATANRVTIPASVQPGDLLVLSLSQASAVTNSAPSGGGWTSLGSTADNRNESRTTTWTKVATAADAGASITVTASAQVKFVMAALAYSGVNQASPVASYNAVAETVSRTTHTTPGAASAPAGSWVVSVWTDKSSATTSWAEPAGQTARVEAFVSGSGRESVLITDSNGPVAGGAQPGLTATADSASSKAVMATLVLNP